MNDLVLPRRRRLTAQYEDGGTPAGFDETPESRYRHVYFEVLDKLTMSITDRFNENPRDHQDARDHAEAMAMDRILRNYVCELFLVQRCLQESS